MRTGAVIWRPFHEREADRLAVITTKYDWPRGAFKNPDVDFLLRYINSQRDELRIVRESRLWAPTCRRGHIGHAADAVFCVTCGARL